MAQTWADHLMKTNTFSYTFGENIWKQEGTLVSNKGSDPVDSWYSEGKNYNYERAEFSPQTGHFTQLVWVASQKLGVGVARRAGKVIVVANYDPPGNYDSRSEFRKNVLKPNILVFGGKR